MTAKGIHTIEGRSNILLDLMVEMFNPTPAQIFHELQALRDKTAEILRTKGISYEALRPALVPQHDRREIALFFDHARIDGLVTAMS